jgi:hypothetical protein
MAMKTWAGMAGAGLLLVGGGAQAALVDVGNGLINDTVLNITWVADAGLSNSQLGGTARWQPLVDWAEDLVYGGYDDWRLASMSVLAGTPTGSTDSVVMAADCATDEVACRDNELAYMYTHYLSGGSNRTGNQTVGDVTLTNIQDTYWSGTEEATRDFEAWRFAFNNGLGPASPNKINLGSGWAVRDGLVPTDDPSVPLPGTALLMALGVLPLAARRLARQRP